MGSIQSHVPKMGGGKLAPQMSFIETPGARSTSGHLVDFPALCTSVSMSVCVCIFIEVTSPGFKEIDESTTWATNKTFSIIASLQSSLVAAAELNSVV